MVVLGVPIASMCIWNRWTSQRQAWECAVSGRTENLSSEIRPAARIRS